MRLTFSNPVPFFDLGPDLVRFDGKYDGKLVRCAVSREALMRRAGIHEADRDVLIELFHRYWNSIKELAIMKHAVGDLYNGYLVLVSTDDLND